MVEGGEPWLFFGGKGSGSFKRGTPLEGRVSVDPESLSTRARSAGLSVLETCVLWVFLVCTKLAKQAELLRW